MRLGSAILVVLLNGFLSVGSGISQQAASAPSGTTSPGVEVATIKPSRPDERGRKLHPSTDRITIENFTLKELIAYAYDLEDNSQVLGGPDWLDKRHFDVAGVAGDAGRGERAALSDFLRNTFRT